MRTFSLLASSSMIVGLLTSCGVFDGSTSDGPKSLSRGPALSIIAPTTNQVFSPAEIIEIQVEPIDFTLEKPMEHGSMAMDSTAAKDRGHYHVYLDSDNDDAWHLTEFEPTTTLHLPATLARGTHFLRFSLRLSDHSPAGWETKVPIVIK